MTDQTDRLQLTTESVEMLSTAILHEAHDCACEIINAYLLEGVLVQVHQIRRLTEWHAVTHRESLMRSRPWYCTWGRHARELTDELIPWEWRICAHVHRYTDVTVSVDGVEQDEGSCIRMAGHTEDHRIQTRPHVDRVLAARSLIIGDITTQ